MFPPSLHQDDDCPVDPAGHRSCFHRLHRRHLGSRPPKVFGLTLAASLCNFVNSPVHEGLLVGREISLHLLAPPASRSRRCLPSWSPRTACSHSVTSVFARKLQLIVYSLTGKVVLLRWGPHGSEVGLHRPRHAVCVAWSRI